jgi:predicted lysophospholipase L1 biosynthesis ABC-type transport system permease subunit
MFGRKMVRDKRSIRAANIVLGAVVMVVAALFAMSFAHSALAAENMATFNGEVIAVDSYDKTFTVKPLESIESESMESSAPLTFNWDKMTSVIMCDQNSSI